MLRTDFRRVFRKALRKAVRKARRALPSSIVNGTRNSVLRPSSYKGSLFRARSVGLSKQEARKACRILANRKLRCIAIRHSASRADRA